MPNELTIPAVQPAAISGTTPAVSTPTQAAAPAPVLSFTNPSLRLDSALGQVVMEFRNDSGAVTRSIPSQQQLDAYKRTGEVPPRPGEPA